MKVGAVSFIVALLLVPASVLAQTTTSSPSAIERAVTFLAGGAAGLAIHESGHVITSLTFGANPQVLRLQSGPVPFFVIAHDPVTRRQEFVISSAGFWMQHVTSEWMLTARPNLSRESAPFLKGLFAFNVGTSVVYSVAAFARSGPPERDTRGMAVSLGRTGVPEPAIGALVLAPALLDSYRFVRPEAAWAKWASRGAKIASVALTVAAGK